MAQGQAGRLAARRVCSPQALNAASPKGLSFSLPFFFRCQSARHPLAISPVVLPAATRGEHSGVGCERPTSTSRHGEPAASVPPASASASPLASRRRKAAHHMCACQLTRGSAAGHADEEGLGAHAAPPAAPPRRAVQVGGRPLQRQALHEGLRLAQRRHAAVKPCSSPARALRRPRCSGGDAEPTDGGGSRAATWSGNRVARLHCIRAGLMSRVVQPTCSALGAPPSATPRAKREPHCLRISALPERAQQCQISR